MEKERKAERERRVIDKVTHRQSQADSEREEEEEMECI